MRTPVRTAACAAVALVLAACGAGGSGGIDGDPVASPTAHAFNACLVSDVAGIDDRAFNASAWQGLQDARSAFGLTARFVESGDESEYAANLAQATADDCRLIVTVGAGMAEATVDAAKANPDLAFMIVDNNPDADPSTPEPDSLPNLKPILFDPSQAAFLAGYVAAGMSQTRKVATFGGAKVPSVTVFMDGFADGITYYGTVTGKKVILLGWDRAKQSGSFIGGEKQKQAEQLGATFIEKGADILMPVAGDAGEGAAVAALATDGKTNLIWANSDGHATLPAQYRPLIITSVLKLAGPATKASAKEAMDGRFSNSAYIGTLANSGVGIAGYHEFDSKIPSALKGQVEQVTAEIISGTLTIDSVSSPD